MGARLGRRRRLLVFFGIALVSWQRRMPFLWVVVPPAVLGAAYSSYVYTAVVFINHAACIVPWAVAGDRRRTARYTVLLIVVLFAIGLRMPDPDLRNWYWLVVPVFCITCAAFFSWVVRTFLRGHYARPPQDLIYIKSMRTATEHLLCPMCGSMHSGTLDHILPREGHAAFAVSR